MAERFPSGPSTRPEPPLFPRKQRLSPGSARSGPGREAAQRTLDGKDRSGIMRGEGKGEPTHEKKRPIEAHNGLQSGRVAPEYR